MINKMLCCLSLILALASTAEAKPNLIFLAIGVNCEAVKEEREDVFAKEATYLEKGIETQCDSLYKITKNYLHSENATKENCLNGFKWVANSTKKEDLAIVYIGTHGEGNKKGHFYFYPVSDTISSKEIITELKQVKCHLFLLIDTCHAEAMIIDWKDCGENVSILTACKANQCASMWKFVIPFVEALKEADYNNDKVVDISEIENYVIKNTKDQQIPVASKTKSKIPISKIQNYLKIIIIKNHFPDSINFKEAILTRRKFYKNFK